ncbi:MAG TPA: hypothetical protein VMO26_09345, partial [Vicinamibacterales bacterium]|nr:hypothetical protein [Vicinamibacterales bacterium]
MAAAHMAGVPARVHTYAGAPYDGVGGIAVALAKTADRVTGMLATHVWAVGRELQQFLENERVVERGRIEVIGRGSSNGVDLANFTPAPRIRPALPPRFIWIGRLSEDKGVAELAALWNVIESQLKG